MDYLDAIRLISLTDTYHRQSDWLRDTLFLELGFRAAFDLLHLDDVMFGGWF